MSHLFHGTAFAHLVRGIFGHSLLRYPDEIDLPDVWLHAVRQESSFNRAEQPQESNALAMETIAVVNERREDQRHGSPTPSDRTRTGSIPAPSKRDAEKGSDHLVVIWYGDGDIDNPQNWSLAKKLWVLGQTYLLTFSIYMGSSIYTAGERGIEEQFGVSQVAATLGLTLFILGYATGPLLFAPLSEIPRIGRMPVYIATLLIFVLIQIPTAKATNFGMLLAFRFLSGWFGSPILAIGGATVADILSPKYREYGITLWVLSASLGPIVGPTVGGYAAVARGWTWTIWELMWASGFCLTVLFFFFPETNPSAILYQRARRLRKATGNQNLCSQSEIDAANIKFRDIVLAVLVLPLTLNFTEPIVLVLNLYLGLVYALLYAWFESFPIVFLGIYHWDERNLGLAFLGMTVGTFICTLLFFLYLAYYQDQRRDKGELRPEDRMLATVASALCLPICLFWFGWTAREDIHWIVPIIGSGWFGMSVILVFNSILNYLTDSYPMYAASVLAANTLLRSAVGAATPLFARAMYNQLGVGWASSVLGFISVSFIPIPIGLYLYGYRLRRLSKKARQDLI